MHRQRHRAAGQPLQPRLPARRGPRKAAARRTRLRRHDRRLLDRVGRSRRRRAERLLGRCEPPSAIFFRFNDEMAMGVIETAGGAGLRVPLDLSAVGFDDIALPFRR